jgi:hypothetical protein
MFKIYSAGLVVLALTLSSGSAFAGTVTSNLLLNPGAEIGTGNDAGSTVADWTLGGTSNPGRDNGDFDGFPPHSGSFDFYGGSGSAFPDQSPNPAGSLSQVVNLVSDGVNTAAIDAGEDTLNVQFFEVSLNQDQTPLNDAASIDVTFENASQSALSGGYHSGEISNITVPWQEVNGSVAIPAGTRYLDYTMNFYLNAGTDVDSFVDDNSATISTGGPVTGTGTGTSPGSGSSVPLPSGAYSALAMLGFLLACKICRDRMRLHAES